MVAHSMPCSLVYASRFFLTLASSLSRVSTFAFSRPRSVASPAEAFLASSFWAFSLLSSASRELTLGCAALLAGHAYVSRATLRVEPLFGLAQLISLPAQPLSRHGIVARLHLRGHEPLLDR
jgi:hypothetical protein